MSLAANAARMIKARGATITLTRTTNAPPDPETPWIPGEPTAAVYTLDAFVRGAAAEFIDGATVVASDLMVVASPKAVLNGAAVDIVPEMSDVLQIGGTDKAIKKIMPAPAAGPAALFRIFVAS
jgi:non-ribosomal peptide synthetase component F